MKIGEPLLKILNKVYAPNELVEAQLGHHDLQFKTDHKGMPVLLFIGKKTAKGTIKGRRYVRQVTLKDGTLKERWEEKGKASP